jgi:hypothetical protein
MIISFAALVGVAYLIVSALTYRIGFPLDDALIHLTGHRPDGYVILSLNQHGRRYRYAQAPNLP